MKKIGKFIFALLRGFPHETSHGLKRRSANKPKLSCIKEGSNNPQTEQQQHPPAEQRPVREQPQPQAFFDSGAEVKDLDYWKQILEENTASHHEYQKAHEEVLKAATSLEDLDWFNNTTGSSGPLTPALIAKLEACKDDLDTWIEVYSNRDELDQFSNFLIAKAISLASTNGEWIDVWNAAENSHDDDVAKVKMALAQTGWTEERWESLRNDTSNDNLEHFAFTQLLTFRLTPPDIISFYVEYDDNWNTDEGVVKEIFKKLFSLTTRQEAN